MARDGGGAQDFATTVEGFGEGFRMTGFFDLQNRLWSAWRESLEVHFATAATISARWPIIATTATGFGDREARREMRIAEISRRPPRVDLAYCQARRERLNSAPLPPGRRARRTKRP